jgi:Flp pilus assembly protein TadG
LTFATIETTSAIFVKESLTIAAYEGARVAVQRKATKKNAVDQAEQFLDARGIVNAKVDVTPKNLQNTKALDVITVEVSAPLAGNSSFIGRFFAGRNVTATVKMLREFDE